MALRAVPDHPKFADLKARLGRPKYVALGCLEAIWHFTGRFTPQGNLGKYTDQAIEAWVEWDGKPGALITALLSAGWLDADPVHRLLVHDWAQHADKATKQALGRIKLSFCVPTVHTPGEQLEHTGPESGTQYAPPVPVPVPVPEPVPEAKAKTKAPAKDKPSPDPRASEFRLTFQDGFKVANGVQAPWDAKEATNLSRFLKANPTITLEQWRHILYNRTLSPVNQKASLSTWVARALAWLDAPADDWGKTLNGGNRSGYGNHGQSRTNGNLTAARVAAGRLAARLADSAGGGARS